MKNIIGIILLIACCGGITKRQPSLSAAKGDAQVKKTAPIRLNERQVIPFEPDSLHNYSNASQYLLDKFNEDLGGLKASDINDIRLIDTSLIKDFGKAEIYKIKFSNLLPEVVMKNNYLVLNREKKQAALVFFDTLTLIKTSVKDFATLLGGVKKVKAKGFYIIYDYFSGEGVFKEILNTLDYPDEGLAVFNSSIDCVSYKPFMLSIRNVDINGDGLCDINFSGEVASFCKGLEMGYGRNDRNPLKVSRINFTYIAKQEMDTHIRYVFDFDDYINRDMPYKVKP